MELVIVFLGIMIATAAFQLCVLIYYMKHDDIVTDTRRLKCAVSYLIS